MPPSLTLPGEGDLVMGELAYQRHCRPFLRMSSMILQALQVI